MHGLDSIAICPPPRTQYHTDMIIKPNFTRRLCASACYCHFALQTLLKNGSTLPLSCCHYPACLLRKHSLARFSYARCKPPTYIHACIRMCVQVTLHGLASMQTYNLYLCARHAQDSAASLSSTVAATGGSAMHYPRAWLARRKISSSLSEFKIVYQLRNNVCIVLLCTTV